MFCKPHRALLNSCSLKDSVVCMLLLLSLMAHASSAKTNLTSWCWLPMLENPLSALPIAW
jgi:hypothetical protein